MMRRQLICSSLALGLAVLFPVVAGAQSGSPLFFVFVESDSVRVDGMLRDWRGVRMRRLGSGDDASMRYAVGYDDEGFYVAASVDDTRLIRNRTPTSRDDAIILTVASPAGRGYQASEIYLFPGIEGRTAGVVQVGAPGGRRRSVNGARIVEAARGQEGYDLEAFIPYTAVPGARDWMRGRAAIRLRDSDREASRDGTTVVASAEMRGRDVSSLPPVTGQGGELGSLASFLRDRGIERSDIRFDLRGDIAADDRPERVVVTHRFAAAMGRGYRDGRSYAYAGIGEVTGRGPIDAELRDVTGDGKDDLILTVEVRGPEGVRTIVSVHTLARGHIELAWAAVLGVRTSEGRFLGRYEIRPTRRGAPTLIIHAGDTEGLGRENFRFRPTGDVVPPIVPWGPIATRSYRFGGREFEVVEETRNRNYREPEPEPEPEQEHREARQRGSETGGRSQSQERRRRRPSMEQLIAAVRRERGIPPSVRPRHEQRVNVAEGPVTEELMVLGRSLLVVGPCFREGQSYFFYELPASEPDDLVAVNAADVTGDGRAEIFVTVRQDLGEGFSRNVLLVYRFTREEGFERALTVEIMRTDGEHRVINDIRFEGQGSRRALVIRPGRAEGWDRSSWPFAGFADDGVDPLLLPWQDRPKRYRLRGDRLVAR